ncbi:MAG: M20/M25/M40 family metallo-hydrolase [Cytophagales bacterium]|nr:M20/M25/M40 family metallo-hydrolase [Cytophagales bacterium]
MRSKIRLVLTTFIYLVNASLWAQEISETELKEHIFYLASDKLEGRLPGTKGETLAFEYIEKHFKAYGLIPKGEKGYRQVFDYTYNPNPHDTVKANGIARTGTNAVAYLDNGADKTVVIGAHYDHLGMGGSSGSLDKKKGKVIHNGADDNASGTAGVLELARYLSGNEIREESNYLFLCFSAEEDGLIGSKYFTNHPTIELAQISYMINMDMIGRLNDSTKNLMVYGFGTSPAFGENVPKNYAGLNIVVDSSGIGPSDHTSFYLKDIPVLSFFTGQHSDYHKSTDDADKINYKGQKLVLEYIAEVLMNLDQQEKLAFTPVKSRQPGRVTFKVTLGIMPDYSFQGKGLRIDAVSEEKPASKAGIKAGDIIVEMDTVKVNDIYDYMKCLGMFNPGETTNVKVLRDDTEMDLSVMF